jgi:hypothetical protein
MWVCCLVSFIYTKIKSLVWFEFDESQIYVVSWLRARIRIVICMKSVLVSLILEKMVVLSTLKQCGLLCEDKFVRTGFVVGSFSCLLIHGTPECGWVSTTTTTTSYGFLCFIWHDAISLFNTGKKTCAKCGASSVLFS